MEGVLRGVKVLEGMGSLRERNTRFKVRNSQ